MNIISLRGGHYERLIDIKAMIDPLMDRKFTTTLPVDQSKATSYLYRPLVNESQVILQLIEKTAKGARVTRILVVDFCESVVKI
jgi:hypothetical protein